MVCVSCQAVLYRPAFRALSDRRSLCIYSYLRFCLLQLSRVLSSKTDHRVCGVVAPKTISGTPDQGALCMLVCKLLCPHMFVGVGARMLLLCLYAPGMYACALVSYRFRVWRELVRWPAAACLGGYSGVPQLAVRGRLTLGVL